MPDTNAPSAAIGEDIQPNPALFEECARRTLTGFPDKFARELAGAVLRVAEFADADQLASVGLTNRWDLTGLYEGTPLTDQSVWDHAANRPVISLFCQPLLLEIRETGVRFEELVRHVVIHEAGHHFGLSDEDMHALEDEVGE